MGDMSWRGGSQEVVRPTTIPWFKMHVTFIMWLKFFVEKK
jgi:hypothetical protein